MEFTDITLRYLGNNKKNIQVVQIGAMDGINFDDTRVLLDMFKWDALLVEPVPEIFNELKENFKDRDNYKYENSAILDYDGTVKMLTIPVNTIETESLHGGYKGMSAVYPLRNGFGSTYERDIEVKSKFGVDIIVPCITFDTLCDKHNITKIDIFICDAEGCDWEIFKQFDFSKYQPSFIRLEYINLNDEEKALTQKKLEDNGYIVNIDINIDAVKKELWNYEINNDYSVEYLIKKYGSDKNLSGYSYFYDKIFTPIKDEVKLFLEIGIGSLDPSSPSSFQGITGLFSYYKQGGSLRVWRDFFKNANIYGVDVAEDCKFQEERINTFIFSSLNKEKCDKILHKTTFDVILDDGLHTADGQLMTMQNLFDRVKTNGYYIVEDIGGGGDDSNLFRDKFDELSKIIDKHEYYFGGNILLVRKNYSGIGNTNDFNIFNKESIKPINIDYMHNIKEYVDKLSNIDRTNLIQYLNTVNKVNVTNTELTVVTGLWNISRHDRDFSHYIEHFKKFLEIPVNMFIFIPSEYEYLVWEIRNKSNTYVKIYELSDIKNMFEPFWNTAQNIRLDESWKNLTGENGWLKTSPQASLEWYNPVVMSKMFMLHDVTIWNPFDSKYFIWLDAGITNTVYDKYLIEERALDKINQYLETFLFLSYPYEANDEIHGFKFNEMNKLAKEKVKYVCRGGLFGGTKEWIHEANSEYYHLLSVSLNNRLMGTEESIFTIMSYLNPDIYRRYELDGNGLIVKFIENLLNDNISLSDKKTNRKFKTLNPDLSNIKTSLYMLTFNFPEQIEYTLKTWEENSSDWLTKPRKILIDNSTNEEARIQNKIIADKWGFEHIIRNENTGINGGRMFAAEHFNDSDSDFYFFFEDDMGLHSSENTGYCRNGFRHYIPNLYDNIHKIIIKENFDFVKLSYTEVYMDNNIQVSWYNIPPDLRTELWPDYDILPVSGLDPNCPRTKFNNIDVLDGISYINGDVYYANWPMIVSKSGNKKMFLETKWTRPYEQTWMSYMFQETIKGNLKPAVLLASPVNHNRIAFYTADERREN